MTFFLLSLGGFPPTAGFIAKWYVFSAAIGAGYYGLAVIGVLSSVVSVFFYLRIVVIMYMSERDARPIPPPVTAVEPRQVSDRRVTVRKDDARLHTVYLGWHVPNHRSKIGAMSVER